MRAKICGVPVAFEAIANAVNGEVYCTVRLAGQENRFVLAEADARAVAATLNIAAVKARGHGVA